MKKFLSRKGTSFELQALALAGAALAAALLGLFRYLNAGEGLFVFLSGLALLLVSLLVAARHRLWVARISAFIESLPLDVWMNDQDGRCFLQSGESRRLMGEMIGKTADELHLPASLWNEWKSDAERVRRGETVYREGALIADGVSRDVFTILAPVIKDGKFLGSAGVNLNITERKKTERKFQRTAEQLAMLNDVARVVASLGSLEEALNLIREQAQRLFPVDAFMTLLYHPETNTVSYPLVYDNGKNWKEAEHELRLDMRSYEILKTGKPLLVNLTEEEFKKVEENKNRTLVGDRASKYRSFIYAPLIGRGGGVIGVIAAISYKFNAYSPKHLKLLESFALHAAIAIENARLYQALQKELAERKQAEQEVLQLNARLEERVAQRTAELREANESLSAEKALLERYAGQREIMADMTDMLQASLNAREAAAVIENRVRLLFPKLDGALYLPGESGMFEPAAAWGVAAAEPQPYAPNDCWALRRGRPYRFGVELLNPSCAHFRQQAPNHTLCLPLLAQGESVGALHLFTDSEENQLSEEERRLAETAANSAALALANLRLREKLRTQSVRDALTGLYNRRYLDEILPREIHRAGRGGHPLSVLMLDIDHFKAFNDSYGHDAGDVVLKSAAKLILSLIRESDVACRYGGEEFLVVLPETSLEAAVKRAEEMRAAFEKHRLTFNNQPLGQVAVSLGAAAYPQHGENAETLVKSADEALYQAKRKGRNRVEIKA